VKYKGRTSLKEKRISKEVRKKPQKKRWKTLKKGKFPVYRLEDFSEIPGTQIF